MRKCIRELTFISATHEFELKAEHIPGVKNPISDLLSRWKNDTLDIPKLKELIGLEPYHEINITEDMFELNEFW